MKLLLDQNLSHRLIPLLEDLFPDSAHVRALGFAEADDLTLWNYAKERGFVIVTQDPHVSRHALGPPFRGNQGRPPLGSSYRTKIHIAIRRDFSDIHIMIAQLEIRKLSLSEKLNLLESVWTELSSDPDAIGVPQWHKDILDERQRGLEQGTTKILDWDLAKEQIRHRIQ